MSLQPQLLCRFLHERDFDANESIKSDTLCSVFIRQHCATEGRAKATLHSHYLKKGHTNRRNDEIKEDGDGGRRRRLKARVSLSGVVAAHQKRHRASEDGGAVCTVRGSSSRPIYIQSTLSLAGQITPRMGEG